MSDIFFLICKVFLKIPTNKSSSCSSSLSQQPPRLLPSLLTLSSHPGSFPSLSASHPPFFRFFMLLNSFPPSRNPAKAPAALKPRLLSIKPLNRASRRSQWLLVEFLRSLGMVGEVMLNRQRTKARVWEEMKER